MSTRAGTVPSGKRVRASEVDLPVRVGFSVGALVGGTFRVLQVIGEGTMGVVLLAHDELLDRDVALKTVREEFLERPDARARFSLEARAMACLRHVNVVSVYSFAEWKGVPYIVMEHVSGVTLEEWLRMRDRRGLDELLGVLDQLCLGVEAIHRAGMCHRDLNAANVLVADGLRVVIADCGITRALAATTHDGAQSGTPLTMAPELVAGARLDARGLVLADVYALGVLTYRALTGRYPFTGSPEQLGRAHATQPVPCASSVAVGLSPVFDGVLARALARDPTRRTQSASELRTELEAARVASRESGRTARAMRLLVVDDDDDNCEALSQALAIAFPGAVVEQAPDGVAALAAAERNVPSLIVTDLRMPRMSGVELLAAVRGTPALADVPVVVVSGIGEAVDWALLERLGASGCIPKPFDTQQIASLVRALLA